MNKLIIATLLLTSACIIDNPSVVEMQENQIKLLRAENKNLQYDVYIARKELTACSKQNSPTK